MPGTGTLHHTRLELQPPGSRKAAISLPIIGYVFAVAAASLIGGALVAFTPLRRGYSLRLAVAFGAGFLIAVVLGGMLPHALGGGPSAAVWIIVGYVAVFFTEKLVSPHGHHEDEHADVIGRWAAHAVLVGLLFHSFFDGVAIASGFGASERVGVLLGTGVLLHKAPEGAAVVALLVATGSSRLRAVAAVLFLGAATLAGAALMSRAAAFSEQGLALGAGVTIYVAASHLIPEVRAHGAWPSVWSVIVGVITYFVAVALMGGMHL